MKKNKQNSMPLLMMVFFIGCVVCNIIGGIISTTPIEMSNYLSGVVYYTVPTFLGRTVGLNSVGGGNSLIFTLVSSLFLLTISVKLYLADSGEVITDFAQKPESALSRALHFTVSFFCLERIAYGILDSSYYKETSIFVLVIFIVYVVLGMLTNGDIDENHRKKFACRILSTFGFIMGIAGLSNVIWHKNLVKFIVIPSSVAQWMEQIAEKSKPTWSSMVVLLLITSILATIGIICAQKMVFNGPELAFTGSAACLFILGGYWHYSGNFNTHASLQAVAYWVLLLIIVVIWAKISQHKIKVILYGIGTICGLGSFIHAVRIFAKPCNYAMEIFEQWLEPYQTKAFTWAAELVHNEFGAGVLICIIGIGVFLLMTIPVSRVSEKLTIPSDIMLTSSKFFLCFIVVRFMDKSFLPWDLNPVCYYIMMITACGMVSSLLGYAVKLDIRGFIHCIVIIIMTVVMGGYFAIFAPVVGIIAFAIFAAVSTFSIIGSLKNYQVSQEEQRKQAFDAANQALDQAQKLGADSRDVSRARISVNFHLGKK